MYALTPSEGGRARRYGLAIRLAVRHVLPKARESLFNFSDVKVTFTKKSSLFEFASRGVFAGSRQKAEIF